MRKFKRLASLALAAVMTLGMCAPAFAVEEDPVGGQQTGEKKKVTYNIYQIFKGTYSPDIEDTLGQIKWGKNGTGYDENNEDKAVEANVLTELKAVSGEEKSNNEKLEVIKKYVNMNTEVYKEHTEEAYKAATVGVEPGYYLVATKTMGPDDVATTYVVNVTGTTLTINPKTSKPEVNKKVDDSDVNSASVGDILTFTITGSLPNNYEDFKTYYYQFTDTMSKGLRYANTAEDPVGITFNGKDIKDGLFNIVTSGSDASGTTITITSENLKNETTGLTYDPTKENKIVVTYKAEITEYALMGKEGPTTNKVILKYSNDPDKSGSGDPGKPGGDPNHPIGTTVDGEAGTTETYITGLTVTDFDENKKPMTGATFELTSTSNPSGINAELIWSSTFEEAADGEYWKLNGDEEKYTKVAPTEETQGQYADKSKKYKLTYNVDVVPTKDGENKDQKVTAVIDANGALHIAGLNVGSYKLHQINAPAGYNVAADIEWTISFSKEKKEFSSDKPNEVECINNWFYINLTQGQGALLPETGGVGTTMMYIGGMLLIAMAGATIILKGKKAEDSAE